MTVTRLDVVVRLREVEEEKALDTLARAQRKAAEAEVQARLAKEKAQVELSAHDSSHWLMEEQGRLRAALDAKRAQKAAEQASKEVEVKRAAYTSSYQRAEVVRRVSSARLAEARAEEDRREDLLLDEAASMLHFRKAG